jgi:rod shape-determining protein MreC
METFLARYRNITVLALAIFAQLLLLGYQIRSDRDVPLIRMWGVTAVTPAARVVHGGHGLASHFWNNYVWLRGAQKQNEQLRAEMDRLKLENQSLRSALRTSGQMNVLASYQQSITSETKIASVIGTGANPNSRVLFLDLGSGAGVKPGMAVITPDGIVGKVQAAFPGAALVQLIDDPNSAVGVILDTSRAHGVMKGTGLNEGRIDYVPNEEKTPPGEKVYTSGEDRIYPKGLLVGTVASSQPGRDFQEIIVRPSVRLDRMEEVLVVTKGVHQELPGKLPRAQAPEVLLPRPPAEYRDDFLAPPGQVGAQAGGAGAAGAAPGAPAAGTASPVAGPPVAAVPATGYVPETDADRIRKRYQEIGAAQGHIFGEGTPGSKPPDFNLGLTPKPASGSRPPAGGAAAPGVSTGPSAIPSAPVKSPVPAPPAAPSATPRR